MSDFGAVHTAYDLAVYASPLRLPSRRKTRFRLAATLGRTGLLPARSVRKVSETPLSPLTHVISSPFPRLRLAHAWHLYGTFTYRIAVLIVVLDRNPPQIDPADIRNIRVLATVLGGRVTYSDLPEYDRVRPL